MLGHKTRLSKFKIEIILRTFSDHSAIKLEVNQKTTVKHTKTGRQNNTLLNKEWVNSEIKEEIKKYIETNEKKNTTTPQKQTIQLKMGKGPE